MSGEVVPLPGAARHPLELEAGLTDLANAARLAAVAGGNARFVVPWAAWRIWDGCTWREDDCGRLAFYAREVASALFDDAAASPQGVMARTARFAAASSSRRGVEAMTSLAATEPGVPILPSAFDAQPMILNVENGALDLEHGRIREHRRGDFFTKSAAVKFDPTASDPLFDRFISEATGGDTDFAECLRRYTGYSLSGDTSEEVFFLLLGQAGTGKSTYVESVMAMLGGFALKSSFDTFLEQRNVGGARPDLAALRGVRMTAAVETARRHRLAEPLLKEFVGGDLITCRYLYGQPFTYRPQAKVFLASNEPPVITDTDSGIWRRLRRLPFEHVAAKPDRRLKAHLVGAPSARSAMLRWALQGCLDWQRDGLGTCSRVERATQELRVSMNPTHEFFDQATVAGPGHLVPMAELRRAYEDWTSRNGVRPVSTREWATRLQSMGCERWQGPRPDRVWHWRGIGLLSDRIEL